MISSSRSNAWSAHRGLGKLREPGMCLARKVHPPTVMISLMSSPASSLALSCCLPIVSMGSTFHRRDLPQSSADRRPCQCRPAHLCRDQEHVWLAVHAVQPLGRPEPSRLLAFL